MNATADHLAASQKSERPAWPGMLWVALAVASSAGIIWLSAHYGAEYLGHLSSRDCGTGRMGALGTVTLVPLLVAVPWLAWAAADRAQAAVPVARCSTVACGLASNLVALLAVALEAAR